MEWDEHCATISHGLEGVSRYHVAAFSASITERLLPNYEAFCVEEGLRGGQVVETLMEDTWETIRREDASPGNIRKAIDAVTKLVPDADDYGSNYVAEAQNALSCLFVTLKLLSEADSVSVTSSITLALESIYGYLEFTTMPLLFNLADNSARTWLMQSPLLRSEMEKQLSDVATLRASRMSDTLIRSLRSDNRHLGVQPLERGLIRPLASARAKHRSTSPDVRTIFKEVRFLQDS